VPDEDVAVPATATDGDEPGSDDDKSVAETAAADESSSDDPPAGDTAAPTEAGSGSDDGPGSASTTAAEPGSGSTEQSGSEISAGPGSDDKPARDNKAAAVDESGSDDKPSGKTAVPAEAGSGTNPAEPPGGGRTKGSPKPAAKKVAGRKRPAKKAAAPARRKAKPSSVPRKAASAPAMALVQADDETLQMSAKEIAATPPGQPQQQPQQQPQPQPQARRPRQRGVRAALATLPVPEAGPSFWVDIETALADQAPLAIAARPAIRPITEPPPLSQPKLSDYIDAAHARPQEGVKVTSSPQGTSTATGDTRSTSSDFGLGGGRGRGRTFGVIAVLIILGLLIAGTIMGDGDDEPPTSTGGDANPTTTAPDDTTPTTAPVVPGLEATARLTTTGIGPLQVGQALAQITEAGVAANVDQPTFDASGGTCFDARPVGVADLTLRFRSPEPGVPVADPSAGVLGAVSISDVDGSLRATDAEVGLGATEEVVLDAHAGALEVTDNPSRPGGHVYLARSPDNPNVGIAYSTDGRRVTDISVGETTLIGLNQTCA
jgi:hypothetical protein